MTYNNGAAVIMKPIWSSSMPMHNVHWKKWPLDEAKRLKVEIKLEFVYERQRGEFVWA